MATVLVTGAGSGIGLATARRFAEAGDTVFAGVLDTDDVAELERAAGEGLAVTVLPLDVTESASVDRFVGRALGETGRLDVVVNNAGKVVIAPVEETDDDEAKDIFEVNVFGALRMMRAALPTMREQGGGTIVNISSISALAPPPFYGVYAATKSALEALSDALTYEGRPFGVRVVVIEPGNIRTRILEHALHARRFTPDSPYAGLRADTKAAARELISQVMTERHWSESRLVADVVHSAVASPEPRTRYPVGPDAEQVAKAVAELGREVLAEAMFASMAASGDAAARPGDEPG
ncbi:MAG: SDR family oxidoreductase [Acidimicrobiia bacterium]|nr:SDR family oxidoreductase [Acidimicrobiia bacterium]